MASLADLPPPGKMNFPGPIGTKRRRMRSGGNVSTLSNNNAPPVQVENISEEKTTQTSKCKGANTIPIFLKKTYKMIDTCNPEIASWNPEGDMFTVKDPDMFATQIIPQYFDHNKFSSFARQLNFYGFRKMQSKPIRNSDYDAGTAKHVTFYNENFKRGRCDLLKKIQRSTRGGNAASGGDPAKEIAGLREQVTSLEQKMAEMNVQFEERLRRLEMDLLARMEQMMLQQQQQSQLQLHKAASIGSTTQASSHSSHTQQMPQVMDTTGNFLYQRGESIQSTGSIGMNSVGGMRNTSTGPNLVTMNSIGFQQPMQQQQQQQPMQQHKMAAPPTLPPHPKQKQLPMGGLPTMAGPTERLNSLRGISQFSRGISRGASVESSASAVLMRNSWEDKFFTMLMSENNEQQQQNMVGMQNPANGVMMNPTPIAETGGNSNVAANRRTDYGGNPAEDGGNDMSSVSSSDIP